MQPVNAGIHAIAKAPAQGHATALVRVDQQPYLTALCAAQCGAHHTFHCFCCCVVLLSVEVSLSCQSLDMV